MIFRKSYLSVNGENYKTNEICSVSNLKFDIQYPFWFKRKVLIQRTRICFERKCGTVAGGDEIGIMILSVICENKKPPQLNEAALLQLSRKADPLLFNYFIYCGSVICNNLNNINAFYKVWKIKAGIFLIIWNDLDKRSVCCVYPDCPDLFICYNIQRICYGIRI